MLAFYCRRFENKILRAYAEHHSSNVITNLISVAAAVLAIRHYWWIDPTGAIIVSSNATLLVFNIFSFSKPSQLPLTVFCKKKKNGISTLSQVIFHFHSLPWHGSISGMRMEFFMAPWNWTLLLSYYNDFLNLLCRYYYIHWIHGRRRSLRIYLY